MNTAFNKINDTNCQRVHSDRRRATVRSFFYSIFMNRRRGERRQDYGDDNTYVDIHGPYVSAAAVAVMILCVMDAFFTLLLIDRGASELNPFLAWMLEIDTMWFYLSKYLITAICVLWVVMHKHFNFFGFKGRHILTGAIACYVTLVTYQVSMLSNIL